MDLGLNGQSILVTGGSSGIGLATARLLLAEGAVVTICGRDEDRLAVAADELSSDRLLTVRADVLDPAAAARAVATAADRTGRLDGVAAIAGHGRHGSLLDLEPNVVADEIANKVTGLLNIVKPALPWLTESDGRIVALTSPGAARPASEMGAVSAARAALDNVVSSLAAELAASGVRVNAVGVGLVDTPRQERRHRSDGDGDYQEWLRGEADRRRIPLARAGRADEVAHACCWLLAPISSYTTGAVIDVTGGLRSR